MLADNSVWQTGRFSWNSATSTATITSTKNIKQRRQRYKLGRWPEAVYAYG